MPLTRIAVESLLTTTLFKRNNCEWRCRLKTWARLTDVIESAKHLSVCVELPVCVLTEPSVAWHDTTITHTRHANHITS